MSNAQDRILLFVAHLETPNFDFRAYGQTAKAATEALKLGLEQHGKQRELNQAWWKEFVSDATVSTLAYGVCTRDGEIIKDVHGQFEQSDTTITYVEIE